MVGTISANYLPSEAGSQLSAFFGRFSLGWDGLLLLILVVPVIGGLTALTSRLTVRRFLTQIS